MTIGYSLALAEAIQNADAGCPGVELGQLCLSKGVSVIEAARKLGVSRQTVYSWFTGRSGIRDNLTGAVNAYLEELRNHDK